MNRRPAASSLSSPSFSDEELVERCRMAETAAWGSLYDRHSPRVAGSVPAAKANPQRALEILENAAGGDGLEAENAAYEVGWILRDRLLRPQQAVAAWSAANEQPASQPSFPIGRGAPGSR